MATSWSALLRGRRITVDGDIVTVALGDERRHRVQVQERADALRLQAVVTSASVTGKLQAPIVDAWMRNRGARLSNFHVDARGRLVGEASIPLPGLTGDELEFCLRLLAEDCDRFEQKLTGSDWE